MPEREIQIILSVFRAIFIVNPLLMGTLRQPWKVFIVSINVSLYQEGSSYRKCEGFGFCKLRPVTGDN